MHTILREAAKTLSQREEELRAELAQVVGAVNKLDEEADRLDVEQPRHF